MMSLAYGKYSFHAYSLLKTFVMCRGAVLGTTEKPNDTSQRVFLMLNFGFLSPIFLLLRFFLFCSLKGFFLPLLKFFLL